jgi:hypothetical protein
MSAGGPRARTNPMLVIALLLVAIAAIVVTLWSLLDHAPIELVP